MTCIKPLALGLLSLVLTACAPQAEDASQPVEDPVSQACQGFEDQQACAQVLQSCIDSGGTFESIALVNTGDQAPMFNIVCRGTETDVDDHPRLPSETDSTAQP